ncbi:unnamed protein product [Brassica oleracea]
MIEPLAVLMYQSASYNNSLFGTEVTAPPGKAIRFFRERTTKPSRGSLSPSLLRRRRSPSLFFLSEPEKRERRWYFCHYLNIISGCRNLYLRCFGVTQPPHRNTPATILAVTSDLASISALPFRYCCKSMMLHERSSQEESLYSTGLSFFTPEMISDLRLWVSFLCHDIMYIAQVASNGRVLTWGAKGEFDAVLKFSGTVNRYVEYVHNFFHARNCWELSLIFLLHLARSVLLDEFQKAVTGMEGADVLSSVKMF